MWLFENFFYDLLRKYMSIPSQSTPSKHRKISCHKYVGKGVWVSQSDRRFEGQTSPKCTTEWLHDREAS